MGISSKLMRGAQVLCGLLLACTVGSASAQQLVNSDATGTGMPTAAPEFQALDISANGRYVLFSNYSLSQIWAFGVGAYPENCRIYRKDRKTGELLTVFESDPDGFEFCNGAKISADGNRVAAAPEGPAGPCTAVQIPANPDDEIVFDCGKVTELLVRDIASGADKQVTRQWVPSGGDLARILAGGGQLPLRYAGPRINGLNADATVAVLPIRDSSGVEHNFAIADVHGNTLGEIVLQKTLTSDAVGVYNVAISPDGARLAVRAVVSSLCQANSSSTACQPPDCGRFSCDSWWLQHPRYEAPIHRIYIIDRLTGTQSVPAALDNLPADATLGANAWSTNGNFLSWIEIPNPLFRVCYFGDPDCQSGPVCDELACELKVHRYNFTSGSLRTRQTLANPDSPDICRAGHCTPQLSRDGNKLLFGRFVGHPFGGDWQPDDTNYPNHADDICVTRASLDSAELEPEFIECPLFGPYPPIYPYNDFPGYAAPVNWYLQDLRTDNTTLVSLTDAGQLFQSNGALLADNGRTAVFRSRDPRLNNLIPGSTHYDESRLPEGCFWSPAGSSSNLLVSTNDNTSILAKTGFYVYPKTPILCPVSYPALPANLYALDIGGGVNLAAMTFGGFGSGTVPMQTWLANPGRARATMVGVDITISGLGAGGRVRVANDTPCEIYPATVDTGENNVLLRCELPALGPLEFQQLRWSISSDKLAFVKIDTAISSNERETQPANNAHISYAAVWPRSVLFNWFGGVR